jgi:predicted DNA-binding protein
VVSSYFKPPREAKRPYVLTLRLEDEDRERLQGLTQERQKTANEVLRDLIRQAVPVPT